MSLSNTSPGSALEYLPSRHDLRSLKEAAAHCQGCDLYQQATQVVFGEGRVHAALFLVGEQPGDREDQHGRPFAIASLVADLEAAAQYVSAQRPK
jgi:hypothetical protein